MFRSLTSKYQTLLAKATEEIQKLRLEKFQMDKDHNNLLKTNVELAEELQKLYSEQKKWRIVEQSMLNANEEFAAEVEKLYDRENDLLQEKEEAAVNLKAREEEVETLKLTILDMKQKTLQQESVNKKMFSQNLTLTTQLVEIFFYLKYFNS